MDWSITMLKNVWARLWRGVPLLFGSVALAVVIWFIIIDSQNETIEERLGFGLSVSAVNISSELDTASRIPSALITIAGRRDIVEDSQPEDFEAQIDLSGLVAGTHQVPISVTSLVEGIVVRTVSPLTVDITLEAVIQRLLPVRVLISNPPPLGFEISDPIPSVQSVTVSGLQQRVDVVDAVIASVDATGVTMDVNLPVTLQARTSSGAVAIGVLIEPETVEVAVPIAQTIFRREVAIIPQLLGRLAAGYRIVDMFVEPRTITIIGSLEALENAEPATTNPVLLTGLRSDLDKSIAIIPPDGLALDDVNYAQVQILVEPIITESMIDVSIKVINSEPDLEIISRPSSVRVTVQGEAPVLAGIDGSSLIATVDASGVRSDISSIPVRIGFNTELEIIDVSPPLVDLVVGSLEN